MPPKKYPTRKRNRNKNFVAIEVAGALALSTLADDAFISVGCQANFTEDFFAISADFSASINSLTAGQGDPSTLAVAHSDYSDAEVREALDIGSLTGPGDQIQMERGRRKVRKVATFQQEGNQDDTFTAMRAIGPNGSIRTRVKLRFLISDPFTLKIGVWNRSGSQLTTGGVLEFDGTIYGRWAI